MQSGDTSNFIRLVVIVGIVCAAVGVAQSQTTKTSTKRPDVNRVTAGRTPWGDPDLEGVYQSDDFRGVPFERPVELGERKYLTDEEYAKRVQDWQKQVQDDQAPTFISPKTGDLGQGNLGYWTNRGKPNRQTSVVIDPPDGRIPYRDGKRQRTGPPSGTSINSPEDLNFGNRCITGGFSMFPKGTENNTVRFIQAPGLVAIISEVIHETRLIPLDGRAHASPEIRQYLGDSRGRWDGDTLVVDVTNFNGKLEFRGGPAGGVSGPDLRLTERFTRIDADTLRYQATVEDPATYTRPWTVQIELKRTSQQFEYACHEGNYSMANMLSGSRADEKRAADGKK
jgi:hypothetical protein